MNSYKKCLVGLYRDCDQLYRGPRVGRSPLWNVIARSLSLGEQLWPFPLGHLKGNWNFVRAFRKFLLTRRTVISFSSLFSHQNHNEHIFISNILRKICFNISRNIPVQILLKNFPFLKDLFSLFLWCLCPKINTSSSVTSDIKVKLFGLVTAAKWSLPFITTTTRRSQELVRAGLKRNERTKRH